jgi:hypothetical protein
LRPIVFGSSKPTHTPTTSDDEKPTNHASLKSLVVPVLPPTAPRTPSRRAEAPVPRPTTSSSIDTIWKATAGESTCVRTTARVSAVAPSASTTRVMSRGSTA